MYGLCAASLSHLPHNQQCPNHTRTHISAAASAISPLAHAILSLLLQPVPPLERLPLPTPPPLRLRLIGLSRAQPPPFPCTLQPLRPLPSPLRVPFRCPICLTTSNAPITRTHAFLQPLPPFHRLLTRSSPYFCSPFRPLNPPFNCSVPEKLAWIVVYVS